MFSAPALSTRGLRTHLVPLSAMLALSWVGLAHASTYSGPVTVSLIAPGGSTSDGSTLSTGPLDLSQILAPGGQILPGDGSAIGSFMLPLEFLQNIGTSFDIRVGEGASNGTTGYLGSGTDPARYQLDGLAIAGQTITSLSYSLKDNFLLTGTSGASNEAALITGQVVKLISPQRIELDLNQIQFRDRGQGESNNYVDFRIDVVTAAVPEPSGALLALLGLTLLGLALRTHPR